MSQTTLEGFDDLVKAQLIELVPMRWRSILPELRHAFYEYAWEAFDVNEDDSL